MDYLEQLGQCKQSADRVRTLLAEAARELWPNLSADAVANEAKRLANLMMSRMDPADSLTRPLLSEYITGLIQMPGTRVRLPPPDPDFVALSHDLADRLHAALTAFRAEYAVRIELAETAVNDTAPRFDINASGADPALHRIYRAHPLLNRDDFNDVIQEVSLNLYQTMSSGQFSPVDGAHLFYWFTSRLKERATSASKRKRRERDRYVTGDVASSEQVPDFISLLRDNPEILKKLGFPDPDSVIARMKQPFQQKVARLRFFHGMSPSEIRSELGVPENSPAVDTALKAWKRISEKVYGKDFEKVLRAAVRAKRPAHDK